MNKRSSKTHKNYKYVSQKLLVNVRIVVNE